MFSNADAIDYSYMAAGTIGSLIVGVSFPAMDYLFGQILNSLNDEGADIVKQVNRLCLYLVYIAIANIVGGFVQVRQTIVVVLAPCTFSKLSPDFSSRFMAGPTLARDRPRSSASAM